MDILEEIVKIREAVEKTNVTLERIAGALNVPAIPARLPEDVVEKSLPLDWRRCFDCGQYHAPDSLCPKWGRSATNNAGQGVNS